MNIFINKSINQVTKITIVSTAFITIFITFLVGYNSYKDHLLELDKIEKNYIKSQKKIIKNETQKALKYIKYKYKTAKNKMNLKELQNLIIDTIEHTRDTRNGSGYIFIYTFDGVNIADPILKYNVGKNLIDFKDPNGKFVIKELINISK